MIRIESNKVYATPSLRHAYEVIYRGQGSTYDPRYVTGRPVPYVWLREINQPLAPIRCTVENDGECEFVKVPRGTIYADQTIKQQPLVDFAPYQGLLR